MSLIDHTNLVLAAGIFKDDGSGIKNAVLPFLGTILIIVLVVKLLREWGKDNFGQMITVAVAAVPVVLFLFLPDQGIAILKAIGQTVFGGG